MRGVVIAGDADRESGFHSSHFRTVNSCRENYAARFSFRRPHARQVFSDVRTRKRPSFAVCCRLCVCTKRETIEPSPPPLPRVLCEDCRAPIFSFAARIFTSMGTYVPIEEERRRWGSRRTSKTNSFARARTYIRHKSLLLEIGE